MSELTVEVISNDADDAGSLRGPLRLDVVASEATHKKLMLVRYVRHAIGSLVGDGVLSPGSRSPSFTVRRERPVISHMTLVETRTRCTPMRKLGELTALSRYLLKGGFRYDRDSYGKTPVFSPRQLAPPSPIPPMSMNPLPPLGARRAGEVPRWRAGRARDQRAVRLGTTFGCRSRRRRRRHLPAPPCRRSCGFRGWRGGGGVDVPGSTISQRFPA